MSRLIFALAAAGEDASTSTLATAWSLLTLSTSFSGIGAPEIAGHYLCMHFIVLLGLHAASYPTSLPVLWACDNDSECIQELLHSPHPPNHLFSDICEFIDPQYFVRLSAKITEFTGTQVVELIKTGKMVTEYAPCVCCQGQGSRLLCRAASAFMHIGGTPCIDYSAQWHAHRCEGGPTFLATIIWMALREKLREPLCVHENVFGFNPELINAMLGHLYIVVSELLDVLNLGWPVSRLRRLTVLIRRDLMVDIIVPFDVFLHSCRRMCRISFLSFVRALESEITSEVLWAESRTGSLSKVSDEDLKGELQGECDAWGADIDVVIALAKLSRWTRSLIAAEVRRLHQYMLLALRKGGRNALSLLVCHLGQETNKHPQFSVTAHMNTVISHSCLVWVHQIGRWFTPNELLLTQGILSDVSERDELMGTGFQTSFCFARNRLRHEVFCQAVMP